MEDSNRVGENRVTKQPPVYLDYNATTPVAPEVIQLMHRCLSEEFGNPSSSYENGQKAAAITTQARHSVACLIGAKSNEITFTGCATEANNLAILGTCRALQKTKNHIVISAIEHPAVLEPARYLQSVGWDLSEVGVDKQGCVSPADIGSVLRPDTALVSVMHANNEVGTIQSIAEISALAKENGSIMHTDAAQSAGKLPIDVDVLGVDLLTIAGHKFYASKGVGALYVRLGTPIENVFYGAEQERGLRPGTENVAAIAGMGMAADLAIRSLQKNTENMRIARDQLHDRLRESVPGLQLNGHTDERLPNTLNVSFPRVSGRQLLSLAGDDVMASLGSACHSEQDTVSGVLAAMGFDAAQALGAVRLSTGLTTSSADIERAAHALIGAWQTLNHGQ